MPLATLAEVKTHLNISASTTTHDTELQAFLEAATEQVEYLIGGPTGVVSFTERHDTCSGIISLRKKPPVTVTSVTPKDEPALSTSDYELDAATVRLLIKRGAGVYTIMYTAGWSSVPKAIRLAGLIIVQHLWQTQNGGGGLPFPGDETLVTLPAGFAIPHRARELLRPFGTPELLPGIA